ncbi:MAG: phage tail protein [Prevotellaceae bacterium]|nr:phage tail protein [Prevotellaceae bacterium]
MRKIFFSTVLALMLAASVFSQGNSGLGFNYQAVVRGADGFVLPRQSVELRFSLLPGQTATAASWVETHNVTTDAVGTIGVTVGKGTKAGGTAATFKDVNFAAVYYWLKVEIKESGSYRELSYTQLTSVPYAEVATVTKDIGVPAGTIVAFGGGTIPAGWFLCDGATKSRSDYANLYNAIGTAWGYGNNSTTFNIPDLRGVFLRGVDGTTGKDIDKVSRAAIKTGGNSGNNVGSYQADAIRNITGAFGTSHTYTPSIDVYDGAFTSRGVAGTHDPTGGSSNNKANGAKFDASRVVPVGSDNRPKNVYVNYIIKY